MLRLTSAVPLQPVLAIVVVFRMIEDLFRLFAHSNSAYRHDLRYGWAAWRRKKSVILGVHGATLGGRKVLHCRTVLLARGYRR